MRAPAAARRFQPGQFYRLQNYETLAAVADGTRVADGRARAHRGVGRPRARTGVDDIVLEMGARDLWRRAPPRGSRWATGRTGTPTEIAPDEAVLLAGGGLGNAVLFCDRPGRSARRPAQEGVYFAGYKKIIDRYKVEEIEGGGGLSGRVGAATRRRGSPPPATGPDLHRQHRAGDGGVRAGRLGAQPIPLGAAARIIAIGSDRMMAAVEARVPRVDRAVPEGAPPRDRLDQLADAMHDERRSARSACSSTSTRQTGRTSYVFSCFNQDQPLDCVDSTRSRSGCGRTPCRRS